jgi:7-keto-8-aminopelargonate synthetase-like enzyme
MQNHMKQGNSFYDIVDQIVSYGVSKGILHLSNEEDTFTHNRIKLKGSEKVNFGSCSYLGLEFDPRLKEAAKEVIDRYGTQFSESRAYVSLKLYTELESLLSQIFEAHCVVMPTTTLGHIATIPVVVGDGDAVILDHQVHNSVQTAAALLKPRGLPVEMLRHSRMDLLEERIKLLAGKYDRVWYMADGIYSMFGDGCPVEEVYGLMERYAQLYFYVDDAHGMSICGRHGRGYVLEGRRLHPKMIMATSLNKAFASGGGVLVFPDAGLARKVRACGGPLITSGPMQPAALGAALAAARIHLSAEIYELQAELRDKRRFAAGLLERYGLPVVSRSRASVFFIGVGLPKVGYNLVDRMLKCGYYLNLGIFPAVPMKQTGVRFTITRLHKYSQIESMIADLAEQLPRALEEEGSSLEDVYRAFRMPVPVSAEPRPRGAGDTGLACGHYRSIEEVDKPLWDGLFAGKGSFDWYGLQSLEACFTGNSLPEENWIFDYLIVRDSRGEVVAATFVTTALWKDDMLSPRGISLQVEAVRKDLPGYLVSRVISTGSLLTEGEHLYIRMDSPRWKHALLLLLERISALQEKYAAQRIVLRDFHGVCPELDELMIRQGYFKVRMPDTHLVQDMSWDKDDYYGHLSKRSRQHYREDVRKYAGSFELTVAPAVVSAGEAAYRYRLYENVKGHSLDLNTFALPKKLFSLLPASPGWEVLLLRLKAAAAGGKPVCMICCYRSAGAYVPMIIGMDYTFNRQYKIYRQALYRIVIRARELEMKKIYLGFAAAAEKKKVGARSVETYAYMQAKDNYNLEVLANMNGGNAGRRSAGRQK